MGIRLPVDASQNVQAAFRDVEQELEALKAAVAALSGGTDLTSVNERIDKIQPPPQLDSDEHVFVGSGPQHSVGLVPNPLSTADNEALLNENGGWGYPARGLVRAASSLGVTGDYQEASDTVNVLGNLVVLGSINADTLNTRDVRTQAWDSVKLTITANQAHAVTATYIAITWDRELYDNGALHATTDTDRITIVNSGYYLVGGSTVWAGNATGYRQIGINKNSDTFTNGSSIMNVAAADTALDGNGRISCAFPVYLVAGDVIRMFGFQNSGGSLNLLGTTALGAANEGTSFFAHKIGG